MTSSKKAKTLKRWLMTIVCIQLEKWNSPYFHFLLSFLKRHRMYLLQYMLYCMTQFSYFFPGLCLFDINVSFTKRHNDRLFSLVHPFLELQTDLYSTFCSSKWNKDAGKEYMKRMLQEIYNADKTYRVSRNQTIQSFYFVIIFPGNT